MLTQKFGLKPAAPEDVFCEFTHQHLNLSFFAKLGYLQKIYKNPTF